MYHRRPSRSTSASNPSHDGSALYAGTRSPSRVAKFPNEPPSTPEKDFFLEEHPYVAISFCHNGNQHTKALIEPFPPEYPAHEVFRHVADALEILDPNGDSYMHLGNDWEKSTMRNQVQLTARKAMAGAHSLTDDQTQALFHELLEVDLPQLTLGEALNVGTGNDPDLKRVVTDHIQFPQDTVRRDDAKSVLEPRLYAF